jgi:hypothetical protein
MDLRRVLTWAIVIFAAYFLATQPHAAASVLNNGFGLLKSAGNQLSSFIESV